MKESMVKTPLYDRHIENGAQMGVFMGCMLPLHFGDAAAEHRAVRTKAGLFDSNHRFEVRFTGRDALANLQNLLCSELKHLQPGVQCRSLMLNFQGGVMDDVQVYCMGENEYRLAMHVCNRDKNLRHIERQKTGDVCIEDLTGALCRLTLDGPTADAVLRSAAKELPAEKGNFVITTVAGIPCRLSRAGFAGEEGFRLCCSVEDGARLYDALLPAGRMHGLRSCGMESFNTLRLEAALSVYGMEMDDAVSPMDTGFRRLVDLDKRQFIGRDALVAAGEPRHARIGLKLKQNIPCSGAKLLHRDKHVGAITSGAYCPWMEATLAMALVEKPYREEGRTLFVETEQEPVEAQVVALPFYSRE